VGAVTERWKTNLFQSTGGCMILKMTSLTDKKGEKKTCKYLYKLYLEIYKECPFRSQNKWPRN
jgi:hypothetical protein